MERKKAILGACSLLLLFHLVGRIGMGLPAYRELFVGLTPLNLLLSAVVTFIFQEQWNRGWILRSLLVFLLGLGIEIIGVHTGWPFGSYTYGSRLGPQLGEAPLLIGLNWLLLAYAAAQVARFLPVRDWQRWLLAAALLVTLDIAMEPFAVQFGLWNWHGGPPPWQNYYAWYGVGLVFVIILWPEVKQNPNPVAAFVYFLQLLFFISFLF